MQDQNLHVAAAYEPRVSAPHLQKSLAQAVFKNIPNSQRVIEKHYNQAPIRPELLPAKPKNLIFHGPYWKSRFWHERSFGGIGRFSVKHALFINVCVLKWVKKPFFHDPSGFSTYPHYSTATLYYYYHYLILIGILGFLIYSSSSSVESVQKQRKTRKNGVGIFVGLEW